MDTRSLKISGIILALCLLLVVVIYLTYPIVLRGMWNFLVVNEKPEKSDAIIVLSGGSERVGYAVALFQSGVAPVIIISGGSDTGIMRLTALSSGVPARDILIDDQSWTTFDNAKNTAEIMKERGFKSAAIVTSAYHTRRCSIIFRHFFKNYLVTITAAPYDTSTVEHWWKNSTTSKEVTTEYLKLGYYYLFQQWMR